MREARRSPIPRSRRYRRSCWRRAGAIYARQFRPGFQQWRARAMMTGYYGPSIMEGTALQGRRAFGGTRSANRRSRSRGARVPSLTLRKLTYLRAANAPAAMRFSNQYKPPTNWRASLRSAPAHKLDSRAEVNAADAPPPNRNTHAPRVWVESRRASKRAGDTAQARSAKRCNAGRARAPRRCHPRWPLTRAGRAG